MIRSSYSSKQKSGFTGDDINYSATSLMIGQIKRVIPIDDDDNVSRSHVEYEVEFISDRGGKVVNRARSMTQLFSTNDYEEIILDPNEFAFEGEPLEEATQAFFKNGTQVIVLGMYGKVSDLVILGAVPHSRVSDKPEELKYSPAIKEDGTRYKREFRGYVTEIDKEGAITNTYLGSRTPEGVFERPETHPTVQKIDNTGSYKIYDNEKQIIHLDRVAKKITLLQNAETIKLEEGKFTSEDEGDFQNKIEMDKETQTITVTTQGGATVKVDGKNGEINIKDNGEGTLKIKDNKVGLGIPSAEVVTELSNFLQEMISHMEDLQIETHLGNLGYPTDVPINASSYASTAGALQAIKSLIDSIKGGV